MKSTGAVINQYRFQSIHQIYSCFKNSRSLQDDLHNHSEDKKNRQLNAAGLHVPLINKDHIS